MKGSVGPMAHSVEDIKLALEVLFHPELNHYDPYVPPLPFKEDLYQKSATPGTITIGWLDSIESAPATPAMKRVTALAKSTLEKLGYKVVPVKLAMEDLEEAREIFNAFIYNFIMEPLG